MIATVYAQILIDVLLLITGNLNIVDATVINLAYLAIFSI